MTGHHAVASEGVFGRWFRVMFPLRSVEVKLRRHGKNYNFPFNPANEERPHCKRKRKRSYLRAQENESDGLDDVLGN